MHKFSRKLFLIFLTAVTLICLALGVVACTDGGDPEDPVDTTLAAPYIVLDEETGVITWDAVEHATRYSVYRNGQVDTIVAVTSYTIEDTAYGTYEYAVTSSSSDKTYKTSGLSNAVTWQVKAGGQGSAHQHEYKYTVFMLDESQHVKTCIYCSDVAFEKHVYADKKDLTCEFCDYIRTLDPDEDDDPDDGGDPDEDSDGPAKDPHQHTPVYRDKTDDLHEIVCDDCNEVLQTEAHKYDNDEDTTCNSCSHTRTVQGGTEPEPDVPGGDTSATLGVGTVSAVIPATGHKLHVTFASGVQSGGKYKLELSTTAVAFQDAEIVIKSNGTTVYTKSASAKQTSFEIPLGSVDFASGLDITQNGSTEYNISLQLTEEIAAGGFVLQLNDELTIERNNRSDNFSVSFGSTVTDGATYTLRASAFAQGGTSSITISLEYYENNAKKTKSFSAADSLEFDITVDKKHDLRISYSSTSLTLYNIFLKLTEKVSDIEGVSKENPIVHTFIEGTHTVTGLKNAYIELPNNATGARYTISYGSSIISVGIYDLLSGSVTSTYADGEEIELVSTDGATTLLYVEGANATSWSFTLTEYNEIKEYYLSLTHEEAGVEISAPVEFKLVGVANGTYTLYLDAISGITFEVTVGSGSSITLDYANGQYSKNITINGETYITISASELVNVNRVSLAEAVNSNPLKVKEEYKTYFRTGAFDNFLNYRVYLGSVQKGTYEITFEFESSQSVVYVVTPQKGTYGELGSTTMYFSGTAKIVIDDGCEYITIAFKTYQNGGQNIPVTIWLEESADQTPVMGVGESMEIAIPYAAPGNTTAARIEFAPDVKGSPTKYKLSVYVPNEGGNLSIFAYHSEAELLGANGSIWLQYNAASGKYESKIFENTSGYVYLKQISGGNPVDVPNATVTLSEPGLGIGETIESSSLGQGSIDNRQSKPFSVSLDVDITEGTDLILIIEPTGGSYNAKTILRVSTTGLESDLNDENAYGAGADGKYTIEFKKSANIIYLQTYYPGVKHYFNADITLKAASSGGGGGEEEEIADTTGFSWTYNAGSVKSNGDGGVTINIPLDNANLPTGKGTYKFQVVVTGFSLSYTDGAKVTPQGGDAVRIGGGDIVSGGNEAEITISSKCAFLTFTMSMSNLYGSSATFTFHLLGEGGTVGGGNTDGGNTGGGNTGGGDVGSSDGLSTTTPYVKTMMNEMGMFTVWFSIDLANVAAGKYVITFTFSSDKPGAIYVEPLGGSEVTLNSNGSGTITIPANCGSLSVGFSNFWPDDPVTVTVTLAKA